MSKSRDGRGRERRLEEGVPGGAGVAATLRRNSDSPGPRLSASHEEAPPGRGRREMRGGGGSLCKYTLSHLDK